LSLAAAILLGLALGLGAGVFFGELVAPLGVVGDVFVRLLQMTVLPYVVLSLSTSIGHLDRRSVASLAGRAGLVYLVLSAITLAVVLAFPLSFPDWDAATFFSPTLTEAPAQLDLVQLFVPANPFQALSESVVPAVVIFSVAIGLGLMSMERKGPVLETLSVLSATVSKITNQIIRLAPVGVFAITAKAAGTLGADSLGRLQVYGLAYVGLALVLTLWVLPGLVAALLPISSRQVIGPTRDALVTAFATGNLFVVLPVLTERSKAILEEVAPGDESLAESVDAIVPTFFNLPTAGKLLTLSWIPFAGWFSGSELSAADVPGFLVVGTASFLGSTSIGIPYLLDLFRIPADTFQVFLAIDNLVNSRFGTLLSAMHLVALGLLGACAARGRLRVRPRALIQHALISLVLVMGVVTGTRLLFEHVLSAEYMGYELFASMRPRFEAPVARYVELEDVEPDRPPAGSSWLAHIDRRGELRICYPRDALPFAFFGDHGHLVGLDVELAHELARDLEVKAAFVRMPNVGHLDGALASGRCDVALSGLVITPARARDLELTQPYLEHTLALIVRDHRRSEFASRDAIRALPRVRLAAPEIPHFTEKIARNFPNVEILTIDSPRAFFRDDGERYDALLYSAEAGAAWTFIYPAFSVVVPSATSIKVPIVAAVAADAGELRAFLDHWLALVRSEGLIDQLYEHWILGKAAEAREPRWSVVRNVLGWVE